MPGSLVIHFDAFSESLLDRSFLSYYCLKKDACLSIGQCSFLLLNSTIFQLRHSFPLLPTSAFLLSRLPALGTFRVARFWNSLSHLTRSFFLSFTARVSLYHDKNKSHCQPCWKFAYGSKYKALIFLRTAIPSRNLLPPGTGILWLFERESNFLFSLWNFDQIPKPFWVRLLPFNYPAWNDELKSAGYLCSLTCTLVATI